MALLKRFWSTLGNVSVASLFLLWWEIGGLNKSPIHLGLDKFYYLTIECVYIYRTM